MSIASASILATSLIEGDDILGDGVNIAARLEGLCEPGGVLISGTAYDHVRGKIDAHFVDLGDKDLKNVVRPVRVYALNTELRKCGACPKLSTLELNRKKRAATPVDRRACRSPISAATLSMSISSTGSRRA